MNKITLPVYGITIIHEKESTNNGCITSQMKADDTASNQLFNAAINGLESMILSQFCAGIDITTSAFLEAIETAYQTINQQFKPDNIDSEQDLSSLAAEFDGEVELNNPTDLATLHSIDVARTMVQQAHANYSIVIPDNVQCLWSGEGSGEWLPALVFLPNHVLFDKE